MTKFWYTLRDWSEVWAMVIPLAVLLIKRPKGRGINWLYIYVIFGFLLNFIAIFVNECGNLLPDWMPRGNNIYYNIHSLLMVVCFACYILPYLPLKYQAFIRALLLAYLLFEVVHFGFMHSPFRLSTAHFAVGSIILLIIYLFYFFGAMLEQSETDWVKQPSFIIASGLCIYEVVTFFIFLFIYPLFDHSRNADIKFALFTMRVYQFIFVAFCISLAAGLAKYSLFYKPNKRAA